MNKCGLYKLFNYRKPYNYWLILSDNVMIYTLGFDYIYASHSVETDLSSVDPSFQELRVLL